MSTEDQPREYTRDECRQIFLDTVRSYVHYWNNIVIKGEQSTFECLEGLAFSMLVILDGESSLPGFAVIPEPHPDDKEYHRAEGSNWWPEDVDIAGELHDEFYRPYREAAERLKNEDSGTRADASV